MSHLPNFDPVDVRIDHGPEGAVFHWFDKVNKKSVPRFWGSRVNGAWELRGTLVASTESHGSCVLSP